MTEKNIYYVQFIPLGTQKKGVAIIASENTENIEKVLLESSDFRHLGKLEITLILELPSSTYCGVADIMFVEDIFNDPEYD